MFYGVSYYPEQKSENERSRDITYLKESGINTVRMGEFAWCRMEPFDGVFVFDWLDKVIEELGQAGISTIVCTPTACPPVWLDEKYPEIRYQDNRRVRRPFGGRRNCCYNHPAVRRYSERIAGELGRHYGNNPYVTGFQIDNELAQEGTGRCTCPVCEAKFQEYLEDRYHSIEEYNERSGSVFWSQEYARFDQIHIPVHTIEPGTQNHIGAYYENPTLRMEFERFAGLCQTEYLNLQAAAIRENAAAPVTTNSTGLATNSIDCYAAAENLDCYGFDYYPRLRGARVSSFPYAFARGVKHGRPFWILEFLSGGGHCLGGAGRPQTEPGDFTLAAVHSMAHGAKMMLHFQYRTNPYGAEQLNYAIVDMDGVPRRRYEEMAETAKLLKRLEPLEEAAFSSEAAVCFDYASDWAFRIKPVNEAEFSYVDYCGGWYEAFMSAGIQTDVISFSEDFEQYKLVVIPAGFVMDDTVKKRLRDYVSRGGTLLATFLTGVKNEDNAGLTDTLPSGLTDVFGVTVEEVEPVLSYNHTGLAWAGAMESTENCGNSDNRKDCKVFGPSENGLFRDGIWSEILGGPAEALAVYRGGYKDGKKAVSKQRYGEGTSYYIGTDLTGAARKKLILDIAGRAGLFLSPFDLENRPMTEIVRRRLDGKNLYFVFHFGEEETISFRGDLINVLSGETVHGTVCLRRRSFEIFCDKGAE